MNYELFGENITLENDRVELIPFSDPRSSELKDIIFDDEIWKYMGMCVWDEESLQRYINDTLADQRKSICYPFIVVDKRTGRVSGSTRYGNLNLPSQKCEIGWTWYGKNSQGTGLNKACKFELLKFGFEVIGFKRIQFSADLENVRSQRAIKKLGAQQEGLFRSNYIDLEGNSRDDVYFSIVSGEWNEVKSQYFTEFC